LDQHEQQRESDPKACAARRHTLNANLIRRSDTHGSWDGDTTPGIFDRRAST